MASTQKPANHDSHNSSTQDHASKGGSPRSKPYQSGSNVHKGGAKKDPDGGMPMSEPKKRTY